MKSVYAIFLNIKTAEYIGNSISFCLNSKSTEIPSLKVILKSTSQNRSALCAPSEPIFWIAQFCSARAAAHPPEGFHSIGNEVSYRMKKGHCTSSIPILKHNIKYYKYLFRCPLSAFFQLGCGVEAFRHAHCSQHLTWKLRTFPAMVQLFPLTACLNTAFTAPERLLHVQAPTAVHTLFSFTGVTTDSAS